MSKSLPLKELEVYKLADENWNFFHKDSLGKQFVRSADSISLNICEGYGRFYYKENKLFCYYSRGSLFETAECLIKAMERKLISQEDYTLLCIKIIQLKYRLNNYIRSIGTQK